MKLIEADENAMCFLYVCVINKNRIEYLGGSVGWLTGPSAGSCMLTSQL